MINNQLMSNALNELCRVDADIKQFNLRLNSANLSLKEIKTYERVKSTARTFRKKLIESIEAHYVDNIDINNIMAELQSTSN